MILASHSPLGLWDMLLHYSPVPIEKPSDGPWIHILIRFFTKAILIIEPSTSSSTFSESSIMTPKSVLSSSGRSSTTFYHVGLFPSEVFPVINFTVVAIQIFWVHINTEDTFTEIWKLVREHLTEKNVFFRPEKGGLGLARIFWPFSHKLLLGQ